MSGVMDVAVAGVLVACLIVEIGCLFFALIRNRRVAAYFHAVNAHVYEVNVAAIRAGQPTLDWAVVRRTMDHWDRMIFMAWKPLPTWFPPEYRPTDPER